MNATAQALTTSSQQSGAGAPGCWTLGRGRALTLAPRRAGVLQLRRGRLWVTLDGPHRTGGRVSGDLVLQAGDRLCLGAGQRAVLEAWSGEGDDAPALDWCPGPPGALWRRQWQGAVAQPLADAGAALVLLGRALGRLTLGVVRLACALAPGAQPRCRATP